MFESGWAEGGQILGDLNPYTDGNIENDLEIRFNYGNTGNEGIGQGNIEVFAHKEKFQNKYIMSYQSTVIELKMHPLGHINYC